MRKPAEWMTQADERILEATRESGPRKPGPLRDTIERESGRDYHRETVGRRCRVLRDAGLLAKGDDYKGYAVTELGRAYLSEAADLYELPEGGLKGGVSDLVDEDWTEPEPEEFGSPSTCAVCGGGLDAGSVAQVRIKTLGAANQSTLFLCTDCKNFVLHSADVRIVRSF